MNEQEWKEWLFHAAVCLTVTKKYSEKEIAKIIEWFRHIKGSDERHLIGDEAVDAHLVITQASLQRLGKFDLYGSLMSRLFIYAPLILKEKLAFDE